MNAAVDLLPDDELPTPAVKLDEAILAAAVAAAQREGSAPLDALAQMTGLDSAGAAAGVAELFRYRYLNGAALMRLEPAFDLLGAPEAARRGCVLAREKEGG